MKNKIKFNFDIDTEDLNDLVIPEIHDEYTKSKIIKKKKNKYNASEKTKDKKRRENHER